MLNVQSDEGTWEINLAPQCLTDILIQCRLEGEERTKFTFQFFELVRETLEANGTLDGFLSVNEAQATCFHRWAQQLEACAQLIRGALISTRLESPAQRGTSR